MTTEVLISEWSFPPSLRSLTLHIVDRDVLPPALPRLEELVLVWADNMRDRGRPVATAPVVMTHLRKLTLVTGRNKMPIIIECPELETLEVVASCEQDILARVISDLGKTLVSLTLDNCHHFPPRVDWERLSSLRMTHSADRGWVYRKPADLPFIRWLYELTLDRFHETNGIKVSNLEEYRVAWGMKGPAKQPQADLMNSRNNPWVVPVRTRDSHSSRPSYRLHERINHFPRGVTIHLESRHPEHTTAMEVKTGLSRPRKAGMPRPRKVIVTEIKIKDRAELAAPLSSEVTSVCLGPMAGCIVLPTFPPQVKSLTLDRVILVEPIVFSEGLTEVKLGKILTNVPMSKWSFPSSLEVLTIEANSRLQDVDVLGPSLVKPTLNNVRHFPPAVEWKRLATLSVTGSEITLPRMPHLTELNLD